MGTTGGSSSGADQSNLVVVALPSEDDYVHKISSEKVPHLTLLFLGDYQLGDQTSHVVEYIEHAAATSLERFGLSVDHRGKLGDDEADVLFFEKHYGIKKLELFRAHLLANKDLSLAYHSTTQYPEWTPHLTLGYPESPAKPDDRDYGISWVNFDRIAIWTESYDGPTFQLKSDDRFLSEEVSMSQAQPGAAAAQRVLQHYGVKGMRWGIRKRPVGPSPVVVKIDTKAKKGQTISTSGGHQQAPSDDAVSAAIARRKAQSSGTNSLDNNELQALVKRMNLEQQYAKLNPPAPKGFIRSFVEAKAKETAQSEFDKFVRGEESKVISAVLSAKTAGAAASAASGAKAGAKAAAKSLVDPTPGKHRR